LKKVHLAEKKKRSAAIADEYYDDMDDDDYDSEEEDEWSSANALLSAMYEYEQNNIDDDEENAYDDEEHVFVDDDPLDKLPNNAWVWQLLILSFSVGVCSCLCYYATKVKLSSQKGRFDFAHGQKKGSYSKVKFEESGQSAYDHDDVIHQESDIELIEQQQS